MNFTENYVYSGDIDVSGKIVIHRFTVCDRSYDACVLTIKSVYGNPVSGPDLRSNMLCKCANKPVYVSCVHPRQPPFFESKEDAIEYWNKSLEVREVLNSQYYNIAFSLFFRRWTYETNLYLHWSSFYLCIFFYSHFRSREQ